MPAEGPIAERIELFTERVSKGIDPFYVGELVREGIEQDWPYIFTDNEFEPLIDERFAAVGQRGPVAQTRNRRWCLARDHSFRPCAASD